MNRLPAWFTQELPDKNSARTAEILSLSKVRTVCREAKCPNTNACFRKKTATFLILGDVCTRDCVFCAVRKSGADISSNRNRDTSDLFREPFLVAEAVKQLGLKYAVITSVTRDDLPDGGAAVFASTIQAIREQECNAKVEILIPDFKGDRVSIERVVAARPEIIGHNIETVKRLYPLVREKALYQRSLSVLKIVKDTAPRMTTKSSIMLGLGETEEEIIDTMKDLRYSNCDILTLGQYLSPGPQYYPVREFIEPAQFKKLKDTGLELGFKAVLSGPLVRSSYKADEVFLEVNQCTM